MPADTATHQEWRVAFVWEDSGGRLTDSWWGPYRDFEKATKEAQECALKTHRSNVRLETRTVTESDWTSLQGASADATPQAGTE